jgi:L-lactate dehydrogenase complex protein LldG
MTARDDILRRVRAALADVPAGGPEAEPVLRDYRRTHHETGLVELFAERVADYHATVRRVPRDGLADAIAEELRGKTVVAPADLPDEWAGRIDVRRDEPSLPIGDLDAADAVLTACALGIAETGTIVLDTGEAQGRRALTLVPDLHVCVVREDQVVADVPDAVAALDPSRPLTWISGPSATSDIELQRVEGVHGPRTLIVLLVS